jgi:Zn-dependent peptidase ImmA (M78 family)
MVKYKIRYVVLPKNVAGNINHLKKEIYINKTLDLEIQTIALNHELWHAEMYQIDPKNNTEENNPWHLNTMK